MPGSYLTFLVTKQATLASDVASLNLNAIGARWRATLNLNSTVQRLTVEAAPGSAIVWMRVEVGGQQTEDFGTSFRLARDTWSAVAGVSPQVMATCFGADVIVSLAPTLRTITVFAPSQPPPSPEPLRPPAPALPPLPPVLPPSLPQGLLGRNAGSTEHQQEAPRTIRLDEVWRLLAMAGAVLLMIVIFTVLGCALMYSRRRSTAVHEKYSDSASIEAASEGEHTQPSWGLQRRNDRRWESPDSLTISSSATSLRRIAWLDE